MFLELSNLSVQFGGVKAVSDVNLSIKQGGITGLIGPNGAGKTTFFNALTGFVIPTTGTVSFNGTVVNYSATSYRASCFCDHCVARNINQEFLSLGF